MRGVFHHFLCCLLAVLWATVRGLNEEPLTNKRAPSGFQGMRGKKYDSYLENSFLNDPNILNEFQSEIDGIEKRAPASGFQGMRGKKLYENQFRNMYQYKRIPMGFHGMRGKKDSDMSPTNDFNNELLPSMIENQENYPLELNMDPNAYLIDNNKRAPAMGFQGMRGKKDIEEAKRAPAEGFFGMRGKKQPGYGSSGFFGMRGKKYPYEFRGKFVGVRGKKLLADTASNENEIDDTDNVNVNSLNDNATNLNHLMYLLKENNDRSNEITWTKRKLQEGFFGVRGKKELNI